MLKAVAERLTGLVRDSDIVGRMGGDEFAVVLVQATAMTAQAKAEALARTLEQAPIQFGDWSAPLHLFYGVCEIPHEGEPEAIVAQADAAMFIRKRERQAG